MSQITIRSILETQLATIVPKVSTQYENVVFTPVTNVPAEGLMIILEVLDAGICKLNKQSHISI